MVLKSYTGFNCVRKRKNRYDPVTYVRAEVSLTESSFLM